MSSLARLEGSALVVEDTSLRPREQAEQPAPRIRHLHLARLKNAGREKVASEFEPRHDLALQRCRARPPREKRWQRQHAIPVRLAGTPRHRPPALRRHVGEIIIYAPHITEFSYTHGTLLAEIGYHTRDYFLKQWDKFKSYPGGVLAHSTHLRGQGTYDEHGEHARISVTLAMGISAERCHAHNLGYLDPTSIDVSQWLNREEDGILVVPKAGELLFRLIEPAPVS